MKNINYRNIGLLVLGLFVFSACGREAEKQEETPVLEGPAPVPVAEPLDETTQKIEQLHEEVMFIHDRAMERMGEIRHLSRQLQDSIENTAVNPMEQEETINEYRNRLTKLNQADQAMRQWMRQFNSGEEELSKEKKLLYLSEEKDKIREVDQQMNEAISDARQSLRP